jgi:hypothetical protein
MDIYFFYERWGVWSRFERWNLEASRNARIFAVERVALLDGSFPSRYDNFINCYLIVTELCSELHLMWDTD